MNQSDLKKLAAYFAVIAILGIAYYGNYLPLRKSQSYIYMTRVVGTVRSWEQFKEVAAEPLNKPSPVGQEEIVRSFSNMIVSLIRSNGQNPELTAAILEFVRQHYDPIIERGRGMSFQQNLYVLGLMHQIAFAQTQNPAYLDQAEKYFLTAVELAPRRPQALYGLMDVYLMKNDSVKLKETGRKILELWPTDEKVKSLLEG